MSWLSEVIGTEKAIIAMCHLDPRPGDPYYGSSTMEQVKALKCTRMVIF